MKIHVKNNYLYTENEKFRCSIGLGGLTEKKLRVTIVRQQEILSSRKFITELIN